VLLPVWASGASIPYCPLTRTAGAHTQVTPQAA
jgi:hypothetical protein